MQVTEFAAKGFVQRALRQCQQNNTSASVTPSSVISFFYGVDADTNQGQYQLRTGETIQPMTALWFAGGPDYDALCQPFAETVRLAGTGRLVQTTDSMQWDTTVDGITAQLLLCDQLSRNIFRGTPEAYAYDETALQHARALSSLAVSQPEKECVDTPPPSLEGIVHPPYLASVVMALMHSEQQVDHTRAMDVLEHAQTSTPKALESWWDNQRQYEVEHKQVIDRFGRYPHRNRAKLRTSTAQEEAWLVDTENLPGWAKSQ
eukprot:scaffold43457_cov252-Amphora_coffeaeformis.AAC.1